MTNSKPHEWTAVKISSLAGLSTVGIAIYPFAPALRPYSVLILSLAVSWIVYYWVKSGESPNERRAIVITSMAGLLIATGIVAIERLSHENKPGQWCIPASAPNESGQSNTTLAVGASSASQADLKLDNLLVNEQSSVSGGCLALDIVVANRGNNTALIDGARIRIERIWFLKSTCSGGRGAGAVEVSRNYNTIIDLDIVPSSSRVDELTQEVKADGVDRFRVTARLARPRNIEHSVAIVEATVDMFYNGETNNISSKPFAFASNPTYSNEEFRMSTGTILGQELQTRRVNDFTANISTATEVRNRAIDLTPRVQGYVDELTVTPAKVCTIY